MFQINTQQAAWFVIQALGILLLLKWLSTILINWLIPLLALMIKRRANTNQPVMRDETMMKLPDNPIVGQTTRIDGRMFIYYKDEKAERPMWIETFEGWEEWLDKVNNAEESTHV